MTREELEKELASRYWQRVVSLYFPSDAGYKQGGPLEDPPEEVATRIKLLVDDLYELGVIVDVVDRVPGRGEAGTDDVAKFHRLSNG